MVNLNITEREAQVILLKVAGFTYREIGERLGISWQTVKSHLNNIRIKKEAIELNGSISNTRKIRNF
jgi:DNA-binding CsgD family transcriptional regulator